MDPIKEAFQKAKQDIAELKAQILLLQQEISELKSLIFPDKIPALQHIAPSATEVSSSTPAHIPAHNLPFKGLKSENTSFSTGNDGVPADRQTDQQTDRQPPNSPNISSLYDLPSILTSLDAIKSEVRVNFKRLTKQEMHIFSVIYTLEDQGFIVDYSLLAQKLFLTESSVRDYIQRLIKKGIPISKSKENNKKILLFIPPEFKKIASLPAIEKLREL